RNEMRPNVIKSINNNITASEHNYWKARECRQFFLYIGPCVKKSADSTPCILDKLLPKFLYEHFMELAFSIYVLCSQPPHITFLEVIGNQLMHFQHVVYSVHSLVHMADDLKQHGILYHVSKFPFENFMSRLNRLIHGSKHGAISAAARLCKMEALPTTMIQTSQPDCTVIVNSKPGIITDISDKNMLLFRLFKDPKPLFTRPFNSMLINMYICMQMDDSMFFVAFLKSICDYVMARSDWICGEFDNTTTEVECVMEEFSISRAPNIKDYFKPCQIEIPKVEGLKMLVQDEVDNNYPSSIINNSLFIFNQPDYNDVVRQLCRHHTKESAGQSSETQTGDQNNLENLMRSLSSNIELVVRLSEQFRQLKTRLPDDESAKEVVNIRISVKCALKLVFDDMFMRRLSWTSTNDKMGFRNWRCEITIKRDPALHEFENLSTENFEATYRHAMRKLFYNVKDHLEGRARIRR
ncbi:transposase domain-containing, partial [Schistosoma japonicum]